MNYSDLMTRGEQILSSLELSDYKQPLSIGGSSLEDRALVNLYRDCFAPHVTEYFGAPGDKLVLSRMVDRLIAADNLTHYFLRNHYKIPKIYPTADTNYDSTQLSPIDFEDFKEVVTINPIQAVNETSFEIGTNKVSYLIGDIGVGKSTLVSRLLMDFKTSVVVDKDEFSIIPILYDFEIRYKVENSDSLRSIESSFWYDLYDLTYRAVSENSNLADRCNLEKIYRCFSDDETAKPSIVIHHLRQLIHHFARFKIRVFYIFDNLDGYHYAYTKHSFFKGHTDEQFESVRDNIAALVKEFNYKDLWTSGLDVIFVCRRYLYDYLSCFSDVLPKDAHFSVFQIAKVPTQTVVESRFDLFENAVEVVHEKNKTTKTQKFQEYMDHLRGLLTLQSTAKVVREAHSPVLKALGELGHNGHRSVVRFLSALTLRYQDSDAMKRLFDQQPHLLLILYITNNYKRFSQEQSHFPNLFLCDAVVSPKRGINDVYMTHRHTYWLKYLICKFIDAKSKRNEWVTGDQLIAEFTVKEETGEFSYEPHLVKLALGSLCTTNEYSCIDINYSGHDAAQGLGACRLSLTPRARFLLSHNTHIFQDAHAGEFCFGFHYLQLAVDDKLLALPKQWADKLFTHANYSYLYFDDAPYSSAAKQVLSSKFEAVIYFLKVLQMYCQIEQASRPRLFDKLKYLHALPDFKNLWVQLFKTIEKIIANKARGKGIDYYIKMESQLRDSGDLEKILEMVSILPVEK